LGFLSQLPFCSITTKKRNDVDCQHEGPFAISQNVVINLLVYLLNGATPLVFSWLFDDDVSTKQLYFTLFFLGRAVFNRRRYAKACELLNFEPFGTTAGLDFVRSATSIDVFANGSGVPISKLLSEVQLCSRFDKISNDRLKCCMHSCLNPSIPRNQLKRIGRKFCSDQSI
jgi:hypothetical protein